MQSPGATRVLGDANLAHLVVASAFPYLCASCGMTHARGHSDAHDGLFRCSSCQRCHNQDACSADKVAALLQSGDSDKELRVQADRLVLYEKTELNGDTLAKVGEVVLLEDGVFAASMVHRVVHVAQYTHMEDQERQLKINQERKAGCMKREGNHVCTTVIELAPDGGSVLNVTEMGTWGIKDRLSED